MDRHFLDHTDAELANGFIPRPYTAWFPAPKGAEKGAPGVYFSLMPGLFFAVSSPAYFLHMEGKNSLPISFLFQEPC